MATSIKYREFTVAPPTRDPRLMIALLVALPLLASFGLVFVLLGRQHATAQAPQPDLFAHGLIAIPAAAIFILATSLLWWAVQRRRIVLAEGVLDITATLYRRKVPVAAFDLDKARVINLDEHGEWRPFLKTNGLGMPGLRAGWFRSRGFVKLFCLLTTRDRVLVLPESSGGATLLSAANPSELLDALRSG
jgi:hypothetical protein